MSLIPYLEYKNVKIIIIRTKEFGLYMDVMMHHDDIIKHDIHPSNFYVIHTCPVFDNDYINPWFSERLFLLIHNNLARIKR